VKCEVEVAGSSYAQIMNQKPKKLNKLATHMTGLSEETKQITIRQARSVICVLVIMLYGIVWNFKPSLSVKGLNSCDKIVCVIIAAEGAY